MSICIGIFETMVTLNWKHVKLLDSVNVSHKRPTCICLTQFLCLYELTVSSPNHDSPSFVYSTATSVTRSILPVSCWTAIFTNLCRLPK